MNELQIEAEESGKTLLNKLIDYNKGDLTEEEYLEAQNELERKYDDVLEYRNELMEEYDLEFDKEEYRSEGYYELQRAED